MSYFSLDFTREAEKSSYYYWLDLDPRFQVSGYDVWIATRGSRSLYVNSTDVRGLVGAVVDLHGFLSPLAQSGDKEWDELAVEAFREHVNDARLFDAAGKLNFNLAQNWLNRNAIIDGDAFTVATYAGDDGARFQFLKAPQCYSVDSAYSMGIKQDAQGRAMSYSFHNFRDNKDVRVRASHVFHYAQGLDPCAIRGEGELWSAITDAADIKTINGYNKKNISATASMYFYEYKDLHTNNPTVSLASTMKKQAEKEAAQQDDGDTRHSKVSFDGGRIVSLAPGHRIEMLQNRNPSTEVGAFIKDIRSSLATAFALPAEIVFYLIDLNSSGARMSLQRLRPWLIRRHEVQKMWCSFVWRRVILGLIASGKLRPCKGNFAKVRWLHRSPLTLDVGREGAINLELAKQGFKNPIDFIQELNGMSFADVRDGYEEWERWRKTVSNEDE